MIPSDGRLRWYVNTFPLLLSICEVIGSWYCTRRDRMDQLLRSLHFLFT
jgi:hypothetical protein